MSRLLRDAEYQRLCDTLDSVPADAPTLCGDWTSHDLAIHLWVLKRDPLAWPGIGIRRFGALTDARMARVRERWAYADLVARLRAAGPAIAAMATDALEGHRHALGEYFVHTEDVRRANGLPGTAHSPELQDALWRRARLAARFLHRSGAGLALQRPGADAVRIVPGAGRLVIGEPSELLLWVHGREPVADVEVRTLAA